MAKEVTYTVETIGRKWIQGKSPEGYKGSIEINDVSKAFEIGKTYTFKAKKEFESSGGFTKVFIYPLTTEGVEKETREGVEKKIKKWTSYVVDAANNGRIYTRGIEELRSLNVSEPEIKKYINQANIVHNNNEAKRFLGYIKDNMSRYWYDKGETKVRSAIRELKLLGQENKAKEYSDTLNDYKQEFKMDKNKEIQERKQEEEDKGIYRIERSSGYGGEPFEVGEILRDSKTGNVVAVLSVKSTYFKADGLSFGVGDDSGYIYSAKVRPATENELNEFINKEKKQAETIGKRKDALSILEKIKNDIQADGIRPEDLSSPDKDGYRLADTQNIYGGGSWFVITPDKIWFVRNNGADGDNWSQNNVQTGGAGGIGWYIPYNKDIHDKIYSSSIVLIDQKADMRNDEVIEFKHQDVDKEKNIEKQILKTQDGRSEMSKRIDNSRTAKNVVVGSNRSKWIEHPNRYDIRGIDTKKKRKQKAKKVKNTRIVKM